MSRSGCCCPTRTRPIRWSRSRLAAAAAFVGFLVLAFIFAVAVSRRLQSEIQRLLVAAQRLGSGDFSVEVPAEGNDEFAALGKEFNSMARQLKSRLEELQRERTRLQEAIRRVGESFSASLDRVGLLEIVVQTAVDGIGASAGRATMRDDEDRLKEVARTGEPEAFRRALHAAEAAVIDAGQIAEIQVGGASALAAPLGATEEGDQVIGIVSVARGDRAFTHGERELFAYLTNQAQRVGRERRPARDRAAPGGHRRADRPLQPPPVPGGHDRRGRARPPLRPRARPDHARHRQLQERQRRARPHPGRHGAARGRARPAPVLARDRRAGPLRRRGDGGRAAADRSRGRLPVRRARPPADRGAGPAAASTATGR